MRPSSFCASRQRCVTCSGCQASRHAAVPSSSHSQANRRHSGDKAQLGRLGSRSTRDSHAASLATQPNRKPGAIATPAQSSSTSCCSADSARVMPAPVAAHRSGDCLATPGNHADGGRVLHPGHQHGHSRRPDWSTDRSAPGAPRAVSAGTGWPRGCWPARRGPRTISPSTRSRRAARGTPAAPWCSAGANRPPTTGEHSGERPRRRRLVSYGG